MFMLVHNRTVITGTAMFPNAYIGLKYQPYQYIGRALLHVFASSNDNINTYSYFLNETFRNNFWMYNWLTFGVSPVNNDHHSLSELINTKMATKYKILKAKL